MGKFKDKWDSSLGSNITATALLATPLAPVGAGLLAFNAVKPLWQGDKSRLNEIEQGIADSENSPYNTAKVTEQGEDYYRRAVADYEKFKATTDYGLSPEERNLATDTFSKAQNMSEQNALNQGGGNLAPYINTVSNSNQNDFSVNLAAKDAEIKRQKRADLIGFLGNVGNASNQYNQANQLNFQKQTLTEQALGQAKQDWYSNRDANRRAILDTGAQLAGNVLNVGATIAKGI